MAATRTGSYTLHMAVAKDYLIGLVRRFGAKEALRDFDGTDDEAIALIQADPREVFAMGCDDTDERGYCRGHAKATDKR